MHLSIWPETYCITLSEVWQAGIVPIVSDIGALGERVTHGVNGYKVPFGEPGPVVHILERLTAQPTLIENARSKITHDLFVIPDTHALWLRDLYEKLLCDFSFDKSHNINKVMPASISLSDCGVILNKTSWVSDNGPNNAQSIILGSRIMNVALFRKVMRYRENYGTKETFVRIANAINVTIRKMVGITRL